MRYFKAKKGLFQLRYIYGKLRYPVHFVLSGFFCKLFIYKGLIGFFCVVYVHFIMLLLPARLAQHVGYTMPQLLTTQTVKIIFNNDIFAIHTHNATKIQKKM